MPTWDVTVQFDGPASATDNAVIRFDGTDGRAAQNSGVIIGDCSSATFSSTGLVIAGNLTVEGATTTISSTVTTIADALTIYSFGTTGCSPSNDSGFIVERGGLANVGVIWDESADEFAIVGSTCEDGTTAGDITITAYGNLHALGATLGGDLTVSGGDITLGSSLILSGGDTTSLNLIDAIDATTETTLESALDSLTNLVAVGALDAGSITACFGAIDNGASNITSGGIWSVDIDSASTINASGGGIGAAGSITLGLGADAGLYVSGDDLYVENKTSNNDLVFRINDGGTFTEVARIVGSVSAMKFSEITDPGDPGGGNGGYLYAKADGNPYWRSNEIAEVALVTAAGVGLGLVIALS